ncbi:hypothetical protein [Lactococcus petauri]|uniref:hypothetical protein n=1 Tax=Lactococcus petauri TaxID=1940789 RepID=UPI0018AC2245|nr:hypothetical protein [Lactococcus petauri]MDC0825465.1 hypothetical protein [Lactococcus petauri]
MRYYVKVVLSNGLISQDIDVFSTLEEAKQFKHLTEISGSQAIIYKIELVPVEEEE